MHGLSVQARDGVSSERLAALCELVQQVVAGFLKPRAS